MAEKPETRFKKKVKSALDALPNTWFYKTQERTLRGIPDFILCIKGYFIAIELKVDENPLDPLQMYKAKLIRNSGGLYYLMTPKNFFEIMEDLEDIAED
jgi:hypothetical protein